MHGQNHIKFGN